MGKTQMQLITHLGTHMGLGASGLGLEIPRNMGKGRVVLLGYSK